MLLLGVVLALFLSAPAIGAITAPCNLSPGNLVQNCGFETADLSAWAESGNTGGIFVSPSFGGFLPNSGIQFAAAGPVGSEGLLSQTIATLPGSFYTISFYLASDGGIPNSFSVTWDGATILSQADIQVPDYVFYTFTEIATTSSTSLTFGFRSDPGYLAFDDVSVTSNEVTSVPEPSSLGSLGLAVLAWMASRGRRKREEALGLQ